MGLLDGIKKTLVGGGGDPTEALASDNDKVMKRYMTTVEKISALEAEYEAMTNDSLMKMTSDLKKKVKNGASLDSVLVEAFA